MAGRGGGGGGVAGGEGWRMRGAGEGGGLEGENFGFLFSVAYLMLLSNLVMQCV